MSLHNKIKVAVVGATGYTGLDLVLILSKHPKVSIKHLCATKNLGKKINSFDKRIKKKLPKITHTSKLIWSDLDVIFLSLPNGEAQKFIKKNFTKNFKLKFIDLSADFRIENTKIYATNYKIKHKAKKLINDSFYSIPELNNTDISKYRIISNPGCYPTSIQLPLIPIIKKDQIEINDITIDSKSGYSGAGKNFEKKFSHKNLYHSSLIPLNFFKTNSLKFLIFSIFIENPPAILCPPPFNKIFSCVAAKIIEPISKPIIDLADAFPIFSPKEINITGLLNLSFNLAATIPITPSCHLFPLKIITGSLDKSSVSFKIFVKRSFSRACLSLLN